MGLVRRRSSLSACRSSTVLIGRTAQDAAPPRCRFRKAGKRARDRIQRIGEENRGRGISGMPRWPDRNACSAHEAGRESTRCLHRWDRAGRPVRKPPLRHRFRRAFGTPCQGCTRPARSAADASLHRRERRALLPSAGCSAEQCLHSNEPRKEMSLVPRPCGTSEALRRGAPDSYRRRRDCSDE